MKNLMMTLIAIVFSTQTFAADVSTSPVVLHNRDADATESRIVDYVGDGGHWTCAVTQFLYDGPTKGKEVKYDFSGYELIHDIFIDVPYPRSAPKKTLTIDKGSAQTTMTFNYEYLPEFDFFYSRSFAVMTLNPEGTKVLKIYHEGYDTHVVKHGNLVDVQPDTLEVIMGVRTTCVPK